MTCVTCVTPVLLFTGHPYWEVARSQYCGALYTGNPKGQWDDAGRGDDAHWSAADAHPSTSCTMEILRVSQSIPICTNIATSPLQMQLRHIESNMSAIGNPSPQILSGTRDDSLRQAFAANKLSELTGPDSHPRHIYVHVYV